MRYRWIPWVMAGAIVVPAITFALMFYGPLALSSSDITKPGANSPERPRIDLTASLKDATRRPAHTEESPEGHTPRLLDVAASAGIDFTFYPDEVPGRFFLPENMGGAAGWVDVDGDGLLDLLLTNGCRLPRDPADREFVQRLFRQTSPGQFAEVGDPAGVALTLYAQGCAVGDLNNDGFSDMVMTSFGDVTVLENRGDGTFRADTEQVQDPGWSTSLGLGDIDRDGSLDIYVAHYAIVSLEDIPVCTYAGEQGQTRGYCGPGSYTSESHALFMNGHDGSFREFEFSGDAAPHADGKGLGVIISDLNGDEWPEIYVANDMAPNYLFHNQGNEPGEAPRLAEIAMGTGAAVSGEGKPEAGMGVAAADFDGDHDLDLFITHYYLEKNTYYENTGEFSFLDRSNFVGLAAPSLPYLGFATVPIDYDLDGWQDLFVANGHVLGRGVKPYAMRPQLFRNTGVAKFVEMTSRAGPYFFAEHVSRGAAMADYDNDGDEDIAVVHLNDEPISLLRNDTQRVGKSLGLDLTGTVSARSAVGARLRIRAGNRELTRVIVGGGSYLSASDLRILVGVPAGTTTIQVEVQWPSGQTETWPDLKPGHYWKLVEGAANTPARHQPMASQ